MRTFFFFLFLLNSLFVSAQKRESNGFIALTVGPSFPLGQQSSSASFSESGAHINLVNFGYNFGGAIGGLDAAFKGDRLWDGYHKEIENVNITHNLNSNSSRMDNVLVDFDNVSQGNPINYGGVAKNFNTSTFKDGYSASIDYPNGRLINDLGKYKIQGEIRISGYHNSANGRYIFTTRNGIVFSKSSSGSFSFNIPFNTKEIGFGLIGGSGMTNQALINSTTRINANIVKFNFGGLFKFIY